MSRGFFTRKKNRDERVVLEWCGTHSVSDFAKKKAEYMKVKKNHNPGVQE